jgi:hypothetical protein
MVPREGFYGAKVQQTEIPRNNLNSSVTPKAMSTFSSGFDDAADSKNQRYFEAKNNLAFNFISDEEDM